MTSRNVELERLVEDQARDGRDLFSPPLETSCNPLALEEHEARKLELEALHDHRAASRVAACGEVFGGFARRCGRRDCPSCSRELAARYGLRVLEGLKGFQGSTIQVGLFAMTVELLRLGEGISEFRQSLTTIRRRAPMRSEVLGGSGALEPKLVANRTRWNVHAHVLLDVTNSTLDESRIAKQWKELTGGLFSIDPQHVRVISASAFAGYSTKPDTWAPRPGELDLLRFDRLRRGIKGRQLVIQWGTGRKARNP